MKVPIAGCSHWRREPEFSAAQGASGLDAIDDRLFWSFPSFGDPARRSMLWRAAGGLSSEATKKRRPDRPYVVGEWCSRTGGAWALPFEGADLLLVAHSAATEDWDALCRRGVFLYPDPWGAEAPGTNGPEDLFLIPETINGIPPVFALLPHAASVVLRPRPTAGEARRDAEERREAKSHGDTWDPSRGRLVIDSPYTVALAGWGGRQPAASSGLTLRVDSPFGVLAVSSVGKEPIETSKRLLVTSIGRVEPTGIRWADEQRRDVAEPGRAPLRMEPIRSTLSLRRAGTVKAYRLDTTGKRLEPAPLQKNADGWTLPMDGENGTVHWEVVTE